MHKICVICHSKKGTLRGFAQESLKTCEYVLKVRKKYNLAYDNVILSDLNDYVASYHPGCYRKFTALSKKYRSLLPQESEGTDELSISTADHSGTIFSQARKSSTADEEISTEACKDNLPCPETSVEDTLEDVHLTKVCFICDKERKRSHSMSSSYFHTLHTSEKNGIAAKILSAASEAEDIDMMQKVQDLLDSNQILKYHVCCVTNYKSECRRFMQKEKSSFSKERLCYKYAYEDICKYVEYSILLQNQPCTLTYLRNKYVDRIEEEFLKNNLDTYPSSMLPWYFEKKVLKTFNGRIKIISIEKSKIVIPATGLNIEDINLEYLQNIDVIERAALILREDILNLESERLPTEEEKERLKIPENLKKFYGALLSGNNERIEKCINRKRLVQSFSVDVIEAVTNGRIKTAKLE